ncbi:hypothetical protein Cgig2_020123 [Carnegiea gigantea]|uniref:non-specific serine/threonine protein kinase n=1 Tax=Carnegiea gigantea TaxID=171969 RepID=A0A9Q1KFN4_9CARY|nr:hypothetical protein Cgig2_020123 [Carnegiea gigantea]
MATENADKNSGKHIAQTLTSSSILGLKLYIVILLGVALLLSSCCLLFCLIRRQKNRTRVLLRHHSGIIPLVSKEINALDLDEGSGIKKKMGEILKGDSMEEIGILVEAGERKGKSGSEVSTEDGSSSSRVSVISPGGEVPNIGWGRWYSLRELEAATRGFSGQNVIGEGGYGIVYKGVLDDGSVVAVKKLLNNKGQAEREFKVEVEAIGKVRHKNLVGLVGYCAEGSQRMLVYEYVDNGNLEQWLHGEVGPVSPLTWDIRMKIAIGTAKGYVSPEYASTGMLSEGSDVYSFGVLLMELITGRCPVDYSKPPGEMNLVDWFKGMVASRRGEEVIDPLIPAPPTSRALKRVLLICLRCIDLDANKRPKMGQIVHMLEADEFPFRSLPDFVTSYPIKDHWSTRQAGPLASTTRNALCPIKDIAGDDPDGTMQR